MKIKKKCPCGVVFFCSPAKAERSRCCSKACQYAYARRPSGLTYNIKVKNKGWFDSNNVGFRPVKGVVPSHLKANLIKPGERRSPNTEFKKGQLPHNYKGEFVGYFALHMWVHRKKGKPKKCECCGSKKNLQWANKSWTYQRDLDDWFSLCFRCHRVYDRPAWGEATKLYPEIARRA